LETCWLTNRQTPLTNHTLLTYLLTYLLTPWSRVLLEKLTGSAASQEIPRIFGNRKFITVLTSARHLSLSWANSIQSSQPPPTSWRSILIVRERHDPKIIDHFVTSYFFLLLGGIKKMPALKRIESYVTNGY